MPTVTPPAATRLSFTAARSVAFPIRVSPADLLAIEAVVGNRRGARVGFVRQGINLALAAVAAGKSPPPSAAGQVPYSLLKRAGEAGAASARTRQLLMRFTAPELTAVRAATARGTDEEVTVLVRWGIELNLAASAATEKRGRPVTRS